MSLILVNNRGTTLEEYLTCNVVAGLNNCWVWKRSKPRKYGGAYFAGISEAAHRMSYRFFCGEIPEGLIVRHKCDNPRCINPIHLEIGTKKDNRRDFMERHPRAEDILSNSQKSGGASVKRFWDSMTPEEKKEFCERRARKQKEMYPNGARNGRKIERLAKGHGSKSGTDHPNAKLTQDQADEIKFLYENKKFKRYEIAKMFGIKESLVTAIRDGKAYVKKNEGKR